MGHLRVHAHMFLKKDSDKFRVRSSSYFEWRGSAPHRTNDVWCRSLSRQPWAGLYYLTAPKKGMILCSSSIQPFRGFPVNPEWIFNLVESDKISYQNARKELVSCGKGLCRRLSDLDCWYRNIEQIRLDDHIQATQMRLRQSLSRFAGIPLVDEWKASVSAPGLSRNSVWS